jgi:cyclic-di-GMP-binding protein
MPSFDITSEVNKVELKNAIDQVNKEIGTRFDFKGSDSRIEQTDLVLTIHADDDFKLKQVTEILNAKCAKRGVDLRAFDAKGVERAGGDKVKQVVNVRNGIETELAKKIVKLLKESKIKVQGSIQGEAVRVSGAKKDDLQGAIALVRAQITEVPLQYGNFRD